MPETKYPIKMKQPEEIELDLIVTPKDASDEHTIRKIASIRLGMNLNDIVEIRTIRKSIDARSAKPKVNLKVRIYTHEAPAFSYEPPQYKQAIKGKEVIIVGSGPAGLFAALYLLQHGFRPIVLERGKDVSERKKDIALINRNNEMNTHSNYCFGEGGAGTFSDGKLYSRSKKRGNVQRIFELFHYHGAADNILYEAHPHIGSDKLPAIIRNMRETICRYGGEIHFNCLVDKLIIEDKQIKGCHTSCGKTFHANNLLLAIGHSAHDTYRMLHEQGVKLEAKGFAMGVRAEHPQSLIDSIQYHSKMKDPYLPAASYALVTQVKERGVYSFCMCPGGHIVPAGSDSKGLVVNGMSASHRNSPFANSGIVVEIRPEDIPAPFNGYGELSGLNFQEYLEELCKQQNHDQSLKAPAQRLKDFVNGVSSKDLPPCSYLPGIIPSDLHKWLPSFIRYRLQEGFKDFDKKMKGYVCNDAVIVGVESRSSSPIRIPRDPENYEHIEIKGLYPCGEGAGYAGGITSSAMDGINAAERIVANA